MKVDEYLMARSLLDKPGPGMTSSEESNKEEENEERRLHSEGLRKHWGDVRVQIQAEADSCFATHLQAARAATFSQAFNWPYCCACLKVKHKCLQKTLILTIPFFALVSCKLLTDRFSINAFNAFHDEQSLFGLSEPAWEKSVQISSSISAVPEVDSEIIWTMY